MVSQLVFALYINELVNMCRRLLCPGIYVDEELSDFQLLMYADDICMITDSVGRLQTQLNVLSVFCKQYGLSVNLSKTKIVVFRNGGPLRLCEHFYFYGAQLQSVSHYKYLVCWQHALASSILTGQSEYHQTNIRRERLHAQPPGVLNWQYQ